MSLQAVLVTDQGKDSDLARAFLEERGVKFQEFDSGEIKNLRYTPPYISVPRSGRLYQSLRAIVFATDLDDYL